MKRQHVIVVVALPIVGLVCGLLFTGISRAREAAARTKCYCNLKHMAISVHSYADSGGAAYLNQKIEFGVVEKRGPLVTHDATFPAGTIPHGELPPEQRLSWFVAMLPYIEQDKVFKQFDLTCGPGDPKNDKAASNHIRNLVCPAATGSPEPLAHYVGVAGVGAVAATLPPGHPRAGVFSYDRRTAINRGIPDGTSNTLLIIETANNPGHWAYGGTATVRGLAPGTSPYIGEGRPFGGFHSYNPWVIGTRQHHCGVAMADGSVRSFTHATAPEVLEALATVAGKEELPAEW